MIIKKILIASFIEYRIEKRKCAKPFLIKFSNVRLENGKLIFFMTFH